MGGQRATDPVDGHRSITQSARLRGVAALALVLASGSCISGEPTGSPSAREATLLVRADLSASVIATIVVEVTAPDIPTALAFNIPIINRVATGTITLPAGSGRTITMRAYDAGGIETHRGAATVDVSPTANPTISLVLMPLTGDVPIVVTLGSFSVEVLPATSTLTVGDTVSFRAVIRDQDGTPIGGQVGWATFAPAVARVIPTGQQTARVTAVGPGTTAVVATFGGTAAQTAITVSSDPALPRVMLNTTYSPPIGATIDVPADGDFQAALDSAHPGDQILLAAGATYVGPFTLPAKPGASWIVIRSSTADANLPAEGERIKPSYAAVLPKIVSTDGGAAIQTAPGAHHYRFVGVEMTVTDDVTDNNGLVLLGDGSDAQNSLAQVPHDLILDRTYIHGNATTSLRRCVALNSAATAVIDSYVSECHATGQDAQAIAGWNGPGPFKIVNNYLEGSGENVMFGGADPAIQNLIPSDIEIRRNYFFKPLSWQGVWTAKNLLELKLGQRVLIQGNIFENSWADAQTGFALVFWSANETGPTTWAQTSDVWVRENIIRHVGAGLQLTDVGGFPAIPVARVRFDNNLWIDVTTTWSAELGRLFQVASNTDQLTAIKFYHQTGFADNTIITVASGVTQQFEFGDNIVTHGTTGIKSDDAGDGEATLNLHMPGWLFAGNVLIGAPSASYPAGNFFPDDIAAVGFVNAGGGDYHLGASSPYKGQGSGGTDPGADMDAVLFWTNGVDQ